ncbi:MAG: AarF/ABC1/UbiB kinase family protein [Acidobacteriota bacterium]|nr:AarF/ABC1/UbiB kinase family protein [Acidobacteriota bacterium]
MSAAARTPEVVALERHRDRLAREAVELARPRLWTDTLGPLVSTAWRGVSSLAPDAPLLLLRAASAGTGARIGPAELDRGALRATERLVRRGGPAYIKLGQFIASADGMLPAAWVSAFAWCRDDAPRLSYRRIRSILAREIDLDALAEVDPVPVAAGSIAQVHRAELQDGTPVAVKVRRPGVARKLRSEIGALALAAAAAQSVNERLCAANLPGFVELFAQLALEETDLRLEALNLRDCARVFAECGMDYVTVPTPVEGLVTERVLVTSYIDGVPYDRAAALLGEQVDGDRLLELAIGGVLRSALLCGLFHGDLHAGNVLVRDDGTFGLVDFGICGRFTPTQRAAMARYLVGFAQGDARAQADALRDFGAIPAAGDDLVRELSDELERIATRAGGDITFERLADSVSSQLAILARNGFRMPKELVLFFKNLLYLSSFAASIAPDADLFLAIERALGTIGEHHGAELAQLVGTSAAGTAGSRT